ncbi:MAG: hypothetical protein AB7O97_16265 [Planctomycetota bacterium]
MNAPTRAVRLLLATILAAAAAAQHDGQHEAPPPTTLHEAWTAALSTMRAHKAPGLVFVLPPADAAADPAAVQAALARLARHAMGGLPKLDLRTARDLMLLQVQALRISQARPTEDDPRPIESGLPLAFGLAVPVVATAATAAEAGARPGETVLLLRADGERLAGFAVDLGEPKAVAAALAEHLWAPDALAVRQAAVPPELRDASRELRELRDGATEDAGRARYAARHEELQRRMYAVAPAMVHNQHGQPTSDPVLDGWLLGTTPLGTATGEQWDTCPACGMMAPGLALRSTLKLLAE